MSTAHTSAGRPDRSDFPLRVAVIGLGAFGRRHLEKLRQLATDGLVEICGGVDLDPQRRAEASDLVTPTVADLDGLFDLCPPAIDACIVATPTSTHREVAGRGAAPGAASRQGPA